MERRAVVPRKRKGINMLRTKACRQMSDELSLRRPESALTSLELAEGNKLKIKKTHLGANLVARNGVEILYCLILKNESKE